MKIFRFVKKVFFIRLTILSGFANANFLSCISMNNQECKTRPQKLLMLMEMSLYFFHLVLKQINVVVAVMILIIRLQKFVFLML